MKISQAILFLLGFVTTIHALAVPEAFQSFAESSKELWKRRGGGGGRGGGSVGGGSRGGGSSGGGGRTGRTSSTGGQTSSGSGPQPARYGGGGLYYGGGSTIPFRSGQPSTRGGIRPAFYPAAGLAFFPGIWLYGAYAYSYPHTYTYLNRTTGGNETHPVECVCSRYAECACDAVRQNETDYINSVANNKSIATRGVVDGKQTLLINGTLPNGTTVASAAGSFKQGFAEMSGLWMVVTGVVYTAWFF